MVDENNVIRRLQVVMSTHGFAESKSLMEAIQREGGNVVAALRKIAESSERVGTGAKDGAKSVESAFNGLMRRTLGKEFADAEKMSKDLGKAMAMALQSAGDPAKLQQIAAVISHITMHSKAAADQAASEAAARKQLYAGIREGERVATDAIEMRVAALKKLAVVRQGVADIEQQAASQERARLIQSAARDASPFNNHVAMFQASRASDELELEQARKKARAIIKAFNDEMLAQSAGRAASPFDNHVALWRDAQEEMIKVAREKQQQLAAILINREHNPFDGHVAMWREAQEEMLREAKAKQDQMLAVLSARDNSPFDNHVKLFKEAQEEIVREAKRTAERIAAVNRDRMDSPFNNHVEAFRQRQQQMAAQTLNRQYNPFDEHVRARALAAAQAQADLDKANEAAQAESKRKAAQEDARLDRLARETRSQVNPLGSLEEKKADLEAMGRAGKLSADEFHSAWHKLGQKIDQVKKNLADPTALDMARHDWINFGQQVNDVITMLASGSSITQVLATQSGQFVDIFSRNGGMKGFFQAMLVGAKGVLSTTTGLVTVIGGGMVAAIAGAVAAWDRYNTSVKAVEMSLMGLGRGTSGTAQALADAAEAQASGAGISRMESRGLTAQLAGTGRIDAKLFDSIRAQAKDLAAITGKDLTEAMGDFAKALADPAQGIEVLDSQFNMFNATQLKALQTMVNTGNKSEAQRILVEAQARTVAGAAEKTSIWARAWDQVSNAISDTVDKLGELLDGPSLEQRIESLTKSTEERAQRIRDAQSGRTVVRGYQLNRLQEQQAAEQQQLATNRAEQGRLAENRSMETMQAQANFLSKEMEKRFKGTDPLNEGIKALEEDFARANAAITDAFAKLLPDEEIERWRRDRDFAMRRLNEQFDIKSFGSESVRGVSESASFGLETATLHEYDAALKEIDRAYKEASRSAKASIADPRDLAVAEDRLRQAREDQIRTLRIQTGLNTARNLVGEAFAFRDLIKEFGNLKGLKPEDLGLSPEAFELVMKRLQTAIEHFETPLQQMTKDFELQKQAIEATTMEQEAAVEAERARIEALRQFKDESIAAAAAEQALALARTRANRAADEAVRDASKRRELIGQSPWAQGEIAIRQGREDNIRRFGVGNTDAADSIAEVERLQQRYEMIIQPLEDANRELKGQFDLLRAEQDTWGMTTYEIEKAAAAQQMINQYMRDGVPITEELLANINRYAESVGTVAQMRQSFDDLKKTQESLNDSGKDAFKGIISDLRQGKSLADALTSAFDKLLDKLLDMMIEGIWNPEKGGIWTMLQNPMSILQSFLPKPSVGATGGNLGAPMQWLSTNSGGANGGGYGGDPYAGPIRMATDAGAKAADSYVKGFFEKGINPETFGPMGGSVSARGNSFFEFVRRYEGTAGENGFNTSLANGKFLPGGVEQQLTSLNLGQIDQLQTYMLRNPLNTYNSSALGAGQFTRTTLRGLKGEMGLTDDMLFDEQLQMKLFDRLAIRRGADSIGLRNEWEGLKRANSDEFLSLHRQNYGERAFNGSASNDNLSGGLGTDQLSRDFQDLSTSTQQLSPNLQQFGTDFQSMTNSLQGNVPQISQNLTGLGTATGEGGNMVGGALQNTAGVIGQGANGIGNSIQSLMQSLQGSGGGGGFGGLLSGLFGGGGASWGGMSMSSWTLGSSMNGVGFGIMHGGGEVGVHSQGTRFLTASMHLPTYHQGHRPDEVPTLLQQGEWVLSKDDVQSIKRGGAASPMGQDNRPGGYSGPRVVVHNNGPTDARAEENEDGSVDVYVDALESKFAKKAASGRGPMAKAYAGRAQNKHLRG